MDKVKYPSQYDTILDKPAFLIAVDKTVDLVNDNTPDDETRLAELMIQLTALCMTQAKLVVGAAYRPTDHETTIIDRFYHIVLAADSRWDMVRQYLQDTRNLEVHPLAMISMLRGCTVRDVEHQTQLDHIVIDALDRYATTMENEIKEIMGWSDDDNAQSIELPSIEDNPNLLLEFFQAFKEVGTVKRKRSEYATEEQKHAYDKLMAIFKAISE